jgi:hypothetical protein
MEEVASELNEILTQLWPKVREMEHRAQVTLARKEIGPLSRRFNNEIRDALDHLYGMAASTVSAEQSMNLAAIREHLRRAVVESCEFLVEKQLLKVRPVPIGLEYLGIRRGDRFLREYIVRLWTSRTLWWELLKKFLLIRGTYDRLVMEKLLEGKKHLIMARQSKGVDTEQVMASLGKALKCYDLAAEHIQGQAVRKRLVSVSQGVISIIVGILLAWVLHVFHH